MRRLLLLLSAACLVTWPSSEAVAQGLALSLADQAPSSSDATVRSAYVLGSDDQLQVRVADAPEIGEQPVRIDPAGDIRLPMAGTIRAAGMTIEALEAELIARLKVYIREPDVSVSVVEFHSQPVSVIGAVRSSGVHQLQGAKTLIEILSLVGGISDDAGPSVRITRRREWGPIPLAEATADATGGFTMVEIDLRTLLSSLAPEKNIMVRPHDVITVPRADVVFVIGEVGRPGPVPLTGSTVSVLEALSASGGTLRTASPANSRILRKAADSELRDELSIDLKKIMSGGAQDVPLMAGDILVVPDTGGRRAVIRVLEMAAQAGISIGTWGLVR